MSHHIAHVPNRQVVRRFQLPEQPQPMAHHVAALYLLSLMQCFCVVKCFPSAKFYIIRHMLRNHFEKLLDDTILALLTMNFPFVFPGDVDAQVLQRIATKALVFLRFCNDFLLKYWFSQSYARIFNKNTNFPKGLCNGFPLKSNFSFGFATIFYDNIGFP